MNGRKSRLLRKVWYDLPKRESRRRRRLFAKYQVPHAERGWAYAHLEWILSKMRKAAADKAVEATP